MGIGMGVSFQYSMGRGVIFENRYECGYSSTRLEPAPLPFLFPMKSLNNRYALKI